MAQNKRSGVTFQIAELLAGVARGMPCKCREFGHLVDGDPPSVEQRIEKCDRCVALDALAAARKVYGK